jgi:ABC-2 type transport system permease protein
MTATISPETIAAPMLRTAHRGTAIPFNRLLRVEWFKTIDTRASRWLLAVVALVTVGTMFAPVIAVDSFDQKAGDYLGLAAFAVNMLLPVVAALVMTSEWSQRSVLTTFTQEPRRRRVILAKAGAVGILAGIATVFAAAVSAGALAVSDGLGRDLSWHVSPSIGIGFVLGIALNVAMGVGFGILLQNTPMAIVAIFALPTAFGLLAIPLKSVGQWIDPNHLSGWVTYGQWDGHVVKIVFGLLLWTALPITVGIMRTMRRDIS